MQRFVYVPRLEAYIMAESQQKVIDVTDDIISGNLTHRVNGISEAMLTLQNKNGRYLKPAQTSGPRSMVFNPMDRIIIKASRMGEPFLLFSGYLDESDYYQLYPQPISLKASCSLKLLQHTYFDPGLPAFMQFFQKYGFVYDPKTGQMTDNTGGFGNLGIGGGVHKLIEGALTDIAGWPIQAIDVHDLPESFYDSITRMMKDAASEDEQAFAELQDRLRALLGVPTEVDNGFIDPVQGNISPVEVARLAIGLWDNIEDQVTAVAVAWAESSLKSNAEGHNDDGSFDFGLWQINTVHRGTDSVDQFRQKMFDPNQNVITAHGIWSGAGGSFSPWYTFDGPSPHNGSYRQHLDDARKAVQAAAVSGGSNITTDVPVAGTVASADLTRDKVPASKVATRVVQIAVAESQKGITESGQNSGPDIKKYQDYVGLAQGPSSPWCAAWASWVVGKAGISRIKSASVAGLDSFGSNTTNPRPADLIHWDDRHVGIVVRRTGNRIDYVAGNEGDGVRSGSATLGEASNGIVPRFIRLPGVGLADPNAYNNPLDGDSSSTSDQSQDDRIAAIARQAVWFTLQTQGNNVDESVTLTGKRALANDVSLLEWLTNIVPASGRVFTCKPDGSFLAFYPDYFGYFKRTPYFRLSDIEIIDLKISRNDMNLTTHVFTTGPHGNAAIGVTDRLFSQVASVEESAFKYFINVSPDDPRTPKDDKFDPIQFIRKFGARPFPYDLPDVQHPVLVWMAGWMKFSELWAKQFTASGSFTFMPELLPGGLVAFGDRITMYVEEVTHNFDRSSGFTTSASLIAPAALDDSFSWLPDFGPYNQDQQTPTVKRTT